MRIAIDTRELCGKPTGVGRYLNGLLSEWTSLGDAQKHEFVLLAPAAPAVSLPNSRFELQVVPGANGTRWEQFILPAAVKRLRPDVFFAPAYSAPLGLSTPILLTLHDLSFIEHPAWFRLRERVRRTWLARRSAIKAAIVLTDTAQMREQILKHLEVPSERIRVVRPGVTPPRPPQNPSSINSTPHSSVLFVGSIFNRRHVPDLIRAFGLMAGRHLDITLEIVGENRTHPYQDLAALTSELGLADRVHIRSYEPDDVVHRLYRSARAFAFLSEYEGFGLPPLEALLCGVPAVVTDTPVAREVLGDAALYVTSGDLDRIARSLEALLFDQQVRCRILDRAPAVLARYSWERAARETLTALEDAAHRGKSG